MVIGKVLLAAPRTVTFLPAKPLAVHQTLVPFAPVLAQSRGENPALNEAAEVQAWSEFQLSYLKDSITRALRLHLAVLDLHVQFHSLGDAQMTEGSRFTAANKRVAMQMAA